MRARWAYVHLCGLVLFFFYLATYTPDLDFRPPPPQLTSSSGPSAAALTPSTTTTSSAPPSASPQRAAPSALPSTVGERSGNGDDDGAETSQASPSLTPEAVPAVPIVSASEEKHDAVADGESERADEVLRPEDEEIRQLSEGEVKEDVVEEKGVVDEEEEQSVPDLRSFYKRSDKVAIIVVPEVDHRLGTVVLNALANLPVEWKVQIFHSPEITGNVTSLASLMQYYRIGRLSLTPTINRSMSYDDYSDLMRNISFWEQVQGEHVLTIQTDAVLCSNSPYSINDFLEYDWVGAPWKKWPHLLSGNGGLSLRRKSKMIETITKCVVKKPRVEDLWYAYCFRQLPYMGRDFKVKLAPQEVSQNFAVETLYAPNPMGVHKPWGWLPYEDVEKLIRFCPELLSVAPEGAIRELQEKMDLTSSSSHLPKLTSLKPGLAANKNGKNAKKGKKSPIN